MFIFSQVAIPFIWILRILAEMFRHISRWCYLFYDKLLCASFWLNDITEAEVYPKE